MNAGQLILALQKVDADMLVVIRDAERFTRLIAAIEATAKDCGLAVDVSRIHRGSWEGVKADTLPKIASRGRGFYGSRNW